MKGSLYNHPRVVALIILLIVVTGVNSFFTMPKLEDPHIQSRVVYVTTYFPGADAEQIEAEITEKIEAKVREVAEIKEVQSTSSPGVSAIVIKLDDSVENARPVTARIRDKVAEVTDLPAGASQPEFSDTRIYAHSNIIALTWHADADINYAILGRHARELESRIRNVSGTDFVDIFGLPQEEIRISVDDAALAAHGLTISDLAALIDGSDARGAAGLVSGDNEYVIGVSGELDSLERIRRIPLKFDDVGAALRIGDVAHVSRTYEDPPSNLAYLDGAYGVAIAARMLEDYRIDKWSDSIAAVMDEMAATLPGNIHIDRIFDQREYADERLSELMGNLAVGALVVLAVLLIALGYRASIVAASILPLTLLAALAIVDAMGLRIEQIVVTGMIVALGIMVDNAIVITDEIQQLRLKGVRRAVAVAMTIRKLWLPLAGSTVTTIIAFMPLVLMPGNAGDFLIGIPGAVIASLIASYIIAFSIISAVAGRVVEGRKPEEDAGADAVNPKRIWWRDGIEGRLLSEPFEASLKWALAKPLRAMALAMLIPFAGFYLSGQLTEQFFPISDRNQFRIQVFLPAQAPIEETRHVVETIHKRLAEEKDITGEHWFMGVRPAKFFYSMFGSNEGVNSIAEGVVTTTDFHLIEDMMRRLQAEFDTQFPQATVLLRELVTGPPVPAPIELRVIGPDLAILEEIGQEVRSMLAYEPYVTHTRTSLNAGRPQIEVAAREDDVSVTGLSLSAVESQLRALTSGIVATHVIEETQQVPVRVIADRAQRLDIDSVANMSLLGRNRASFSDRSIQGLTVSAVADVNLVTRVSAIPRIDSERMNGIQAFLEPGILPGDVFKSFSKKLEEANIQLPAGYHLVFAGESAERDEAVAKLLGTAGMLLILMLLAIVLTFNSFRLAYVTFGAAIQAAGLGLLSLWVFNFPINFVVLIGLMGLIGLSINAAIVILSELQGIEAARAGDADAVVHGVMKTGRHILSTTLTTVGGFMPLILAGGVFWPPFAVAIAGGALLSMIVSFYFAPAAFLWITRRRKISAREGQNAAERNAAIAEAFAAEKTKLTPSKSPAE